MIFHITSRAVWYKAVREGALIADSLARDGFIHCSTRAEILPIANRYYRGQSGLCLLAIDESRLTAPLKWESPTGESASPADPEGLHFPHVFGPINLDAVLHVADLQINPDGTFALPESLID